MRESIRIKLETLQERHEEIAALLGDVSVVQDQNRFKALSKEYADLGALVDAFRNYTLAEAARVTAEALMSDPDLEIQSMATEEWKAEKENVETLEKEIQILLLPKDPDDDKNIFLEIRAGTGGHEAALFAGDLARMYLRYAQTKGWVATIASESFGEQGGYKEVVVEISGERVYGCMKFESGGHRVQRVPATESQGRIHTSACTVAIMPEVAAIDSVKIDDKDLRIDVFRASGAGGQHVNKTDSAVRIVHLPTNTVVECQDERSQHKNRAKAMAVLQARILQKQRDVQMKEQSENRRLLVGSGDRSERIRTYNYPQGRLTDHRINLTLYQLEDIMEGKLDAVIDPLMREYQADLLAELGNG